MGIAQIPAPSTSTLKTLGLSVLSTNASVTSLPTNKSITAVIIGGGGSGSWIENSGTIAGSGGSGGASGQVREVTFVLTSAATANCTIGAGGAAVSSSNGTTGGNTTLTIPNVLSITAPGGQGGSITYGGGFGGGGGGGSGGGGTGNGSDGNRGLLLGERSYLIASTQYADSTGGSQNITDSTWTFPVSSVTNNSAAITTGRWVPYNASLVPGVSVDILQDYGTGTTTAPLSIISTIGLTRQGQITVTGNYTGPTTTTAQIAFATQDTFAVLPTTFDLLTRANIRIPGGGGGGGGGNYTTGTARAGGAGSGTGGAGGSGGYSDQANNNIRATYGLAGSQPGGGAGAPGGFGYSGLSGPSGGSNGAGGDGAIYFFWVA